MLLEQSELREMRRGEQDGERRDDGKDEKNDQTETVDDRRRELPVAADSKSRLAVAHPGGEQPQLAEDRAQRRRLVAGHRERSTGVADRVVCGGNVDHRRRRVADGRVTVRPELATAGPRSARAGDGWVMVRPELATAGSRSAPSC